jgi:TPR repeat protein
MNTQGPLRRVLAVLPVLLAFANASWSADGPGNLVGDLGRREAIVVEGNRSFTKEQILDGMLWHIDYYVAAHPDAPLAAYVLLLERKIALGYQHSGFPEVTVKTTANPNTRQIIARVTEGPRYRCGELILSGTKTMTNAMVRQKLLDRLGGLEPGNTTNLSGAAWIRNKSAPFDEFSQAQLAATIGKALEELDYYQPKINVRIATEPGRELAELHVEIVDEGVKGTIGEIEITGLRTNTRQQVLEYLKLKPGMELRASMVGSVSNQLMNSARFLYHAVGLRPQTEPGKFKLELELEELREAAPLNQEFPPETKALLKFREWLLDREKQAEDIVLSTSMSNNWLRLEVEAALSAAGIVLAGRIGLSNQPPELKYAFVASKEQVGFYSPWRKSKYVFQPKGKELSGFVRVTPNLTPGDKHKHQFSVGGGVNSNKGGPPFRVDIELHPTAFVIDPGEEDKRYSLKDGVLAFTTAKGPSDTQIDVQVDAATGRLIRSEMKLEDGQLQIRTEERVFARLLKEITAVSAEHPNEHMTNRGFSSWLSYMATDLIESPLTERFFESWIDENVRLDERANALATAGKVKPFLGLVREVFNKENFGSIFEPLNRLTRRDGVDDEDKFLVPLDDSLLTASANPMVWVGVGVLSYSDAILVRDSWPWILARETAFTLAGQGKYAQAELDKLLKSDEVGPLGYLATARLLGKVNPKLARTFAERGLSQLTASDFRKDYRVLLQNDSIASETLVKALGLVRTLNDARAAVLTTNLPSNEAAFIRQLAQLVREEKDQPASTAAWPAFEEHWDKTMHRYLKAGLDHFLPQVQFLTNSMALYNRGIALVAADATLRDFDEASQCFRKAADQGHAGAGMNLGILYERGQGVPKDFVEAMRWYRKAAEQKEPHAACHVADLYRDGKGVDQDIDEAARWYRIDAENSCSRAQFELGRNDEMQRRMPEALQWFRRAAEAGNVSAQAHLGDMLSEGFFTTPDYVEACQWLTLAARAEDKMSEIRLRRLKAKLTAEQLTEVQKRVAAVTERLEEKERKVKATSSKK